MAKYAQTTTVKNLLSECDIQEHEYKIKTTTRSHIRMDKNAQGRTVVTFKHDSNLMKVCQMRHALIARGFHVSIFYSKESPFNVIAVSADFGACITPGETEY